MASSIEDTMELNSTFYLMLCYNDRVGLFNVCLLISFIQSDQRYDAARNDLPDQRRVRVFCVLVTFSRHHHCHKYHYYGNHHHHNHHYTSQLDNINIISAVQW